MKSSPDNHTAPAPFAVTKRTLNQLFASSRIVQRMLADGWFEVVRAGGPGRPTLYDYQSALRAFQKLKEGCEPPPLPCERKVSLPSTNIHTHTHTTP